MYYGFHARWKMVWGVFLITLFFLLPQSGFGASADAFGTVQQKLIKDGFDAARIKRLYRDPKISFETRGVSMYFVHSEGKLNYDQFLEPSNIRKGKNYMRANHKALDLAERDFGVDREAITAIMMVETRLGSYVGNRLVINTFSTMAALSDRNVRDSLWNTIKGKTTLSKSAFEAKAVKKSGWAYGELKSFLVYTQKHNIDPLAVKGSYAGAMGYCQFLPSNILRLGRDGNGDGQLDLFNHDDAIMSVASYLRHHGWRPGISDQKAAKVIYSYNHSKYYVKTVLKIAKELKG